MIWNSLKDEMTGEQTMENNQQSKLVLIERESDMPQGLLNTPFSDLFKYHNLK